MYIIEYEDTLNTLILVSQCHGNTLYRRGIHKYNVLWTTCDRGKIQEGVIAAKEVTLRKRQPVIHMN